MAKKKERKLTEKEQARAQRLQVLTEELAAEGYCRKDQSISIGYANIMAIVLSIPFFVLFGIWYFMRNGLNFGYSLFYNVLFVVLLLVFTVVHEGIHGVTWGMLAPNGFEKVEFGFMKQYMTPYCTCGEPMSRKVYFLGAVMPCLILGILPAVIGVLTGSFFWLIIGLCMIMGAGGDLTIILKMLRYRSNAAEMILMDHPYECGFIVFERE